jgi:hypothetical protein
MANNGIDEAAQAFDAEISSERAPASNGRAQEEKSPAESVFPNLGKAEVDEESPAKGGGDDEEESIYGEEVEDPDDESDGSDEEGEDDEEGDEEESDEALSAKYKITVDGEEKEVSVKEALEGYIRTETFHKRLSELGENQQIVQRAAADVVQNYEYAKQMIDLMEGQMAQLVPPEPDWDAMFRSDPQKARNLQKYYQQVNEFKSKLDQQRREAVTKLTEHEQAQLRTYAEQESLRFARVNQKNWGTDPKKKAKDLQSMRRTALQEGFSEDEINQVFDSRMLMVLLKASKYDRMIAARPKPIARQVAGKAVTPGPGNKRTGRKGLTVAMKTLARTGNVHDAAPVFDEIIRRR